MTDRRFSIVVLVGLLAALAPTTSAQQPAAAQPPRFRASVDVTSVDVAIVDNQGKPFLNLTPADFTVRVDGKARRVVTAEWVSLATAPSASKALPPVPAGYSSNESATGGRLVAIVVDEPHIRPGGANAVLAAASAFIDRLSPADRVAAISLGMGGAATPFIADRERVKSAIGRMPGQRQTMRTSLTTVTETEALEIMDGNRLTLDQVTLRECANLRPSSAQHFQCRQELEVESGQVADQLRQSTSLTISGLRDVLSGLQAIDGPKTLILMSEGFALRDAGIMSELGSLAAATRTSIYALRLDNQLFDASTYTRPIVIESNLGVRYNGLEALAGAARGALFTVAGTGSQLFASIEAELSGYYLLGVESEAVDRDGKPHQIRIDVSRRGATVRTRRQLLNVPSDLNRPRTARDAVTASLTAPLLSSALPLRVATFSLRGPEQAKVQLLIRAEVGSEYTGAKPAVVGYIIQDRTGRIVDSRTVGVTLTSVMNGVPGSLQYVGGASVDPGEYTIKLAVAEGDRVGSVEHPVHASLVALGEVTLSELMVGGPTDPSDILHPTVGYTVSYGALHGYIEAYGPHVDQVAARYEIAADETGPPLIAVDVPGRVAGPDRTLLTHVMSVARLPPGAYVLRATVTSSGEPLKTLMRQFEIAAPAVLMTSAASIPSSPRTADLFLPVDEGVFGGRFGRDEALKPQNLDPFLQRVPATTKAAFEEGLTELRKANYVGAERSFKRAVRPDVDSTSALAYLAATMAAAGHDTEAASAWQTALIDGSDLPQIYEWLANSLVRTRDFTGARSILEEAVGRWPSDTRFDRTLALSYATLGKGRDALRLLDRFIADGHPEPDLLFLGIEWIFQAHNNHSVVMSGPGDVAMARKFAGQYAQVKGPKQALVQQWIDFLEKEKP
jgi:VWFA-related protein